MVCRLSLLTFDVWLVILPRNTDELEKLCLNALMLLTRPFKKAYHNPESKIGEVCMKGNIYPHSSGRYWVIDWYDDQKSRKFYHDFLHGMDRFWITYPAAIKKGASETTRRKCNGYVRAERCLTIMRSDMEAHIRKERAFDIQKYRQARYTDVIPYMWEWISREDGLTPGGKARYESAIRAWLVPFFEEHPYQLHEIQFDTFKEIIAYIKERGREPKTAKNTCDTLIACLKYAKKSKRITALPEFPGKKDYGIKKKPILWITDADQDRIINAMPKEHQPIFWFLKYHWRREGEAMALLRSDDDPRIDSFIIHRGISKREVVVYTKTGDIHTIPCVSRFKPYLKERLHDLRSPYMFTCQSSRMEGKRYTREILMKIWEDAKVKAGIRSDIGIHDGLRKSSASYAMNVLKKNKFDVQAMGDWADVRSVESYAEYELDRRRGLLEDMGKVIKLRKTS